MRTLAVTVAAAVLAAGLSAQAQPRAMAPRLDASRYGASQSRSNVRTLVLCDTTAFLATRPNLQADRVLARREGRPWERLIGPWFVQNGQFYGESYERAFYKLRRSEGLTRAQVADVQARVGRQMLKEYGFAGLPIAFQRNQQRFCNGWLRGMGLIPF